MKDAGLAWGLGAWAAAVLNGCNMYLFWAYDAFMWFDELFVIGLYVLPVTWLACVAALLLTRRRRLVRYWRVAASLPVAGCFWVFMLLVTFWTTATTRGFNSPASF